MRKVRVIDALYPFWRRIIHERIGLYSAEAAFFLIISFVPLLILLVTPIQFIIPLKQEELFALLTQTLPESLEPFVTRVLADLFSKQTFSIISLSSIFLLWSASRGVHSVIQGLRHIFRTPKTIYYKERLRSLFFTLALIATVLFALVVLVFGNTLWSLISDSFSIHETADGLVTLAKYLVSALLITLFSLLLYCSTAQKPLSSVKTQFPGALFTAAGWIVFSTGFSLYISGFANYSYLYGSLAALILFMLWLYICMWLLFLGAEINLFLYQRHQNALQFTLNTN